MVGEGAEGLRVVVRGSGAKRVGVIPLPPQLVVAVAGERSDRVDLIGVGVVRARGVGLVVAIAGDALAQHRHRGAAQVGRLILGDEGCVILAQQLPMFIVGVERLTGGHQRRRAGLAGPLL